MNNNLANDGSETSRRRVKILNYDNFVQKPISILSNDSNKLDYPAVNMKWTNFLNEIQEIDSQG